MRWIVVLPVLFCAGCAGSPTSATSSPAVATTAPAPAPSPTVTIIGHVTATNGGQGLTGVTLDLQSFPVPSSTVTSTAGAFAFTVPLTTITVSLTAQAAGLVPHRLYVSLLASHTVNVDAIDTAGFDLDFYRRLARNGFDTPGHLEPLRHLTHAPNVYLTTVDDAGATIDTPTLDHAEATIRDAVAMWTAGRYSVAAVARGTAPIAGWMTINWRTDPFSDACGRSDVGVDGGQINFYRLRQCACGDGFLVTAATVRHEVGHALGMWHTGDPADLMSGLVMTACDKVPSARELTSAAVVYARPVGNVDPDNDPSEAVSGLRPMVAR